MGGYDLAAVVRTPWGCPFWRLPALLLCRHPALLKPPWADIARHRVQSFVVVEGQAIHHLVHGPTSAPWGRYPSSRPCGSSRTSSRSPPTPARSDQQAMGICTGQPEEICGRGLGHEQVLHRTMRLRSHPFRDSGRGQAVRHEGR